MRSTGMKVRIVSIAVKSRLRRGATNRVRMRKRVFRDNIILQKQEKSLIKKRKCSSWSKGEKKIGEFLGQNGIQFYAEFYFKDLKMSGKHKLLFYDFYIPKYNLCIEFDGEQHYTLKFRGKALENVRKYDFIKTAFCRSKGISLLRIPYTQFENIETLICNKIDRIDPVI